LYYIVPFYKKNVQLMPHRNHYVLSVQPLATYCCLGK